MNLEDDKQVDDAQSGADFGAGFTGEKAATPPKPDKPDPATTSREEAEPVPEYVQITKADWADVKAAAAKTASYDQQLSKAFGTIGNLQKIINGLQSQTPQGRKIEISDEDLADLAKDFPELATSTRAALTKVLAKFSGTGTAEIDETKLGQAVTDRLHAAQMEDLEEDFPDWHARIGAAAPGQADPNHPFRAWLATKDAAYQQRINATESPRDIQRAINRFQAETKPKPQQPSNRADQRRAQIANAVQPKGDGAPATSAKTDEDEFAAGFNSS